jgi:chromosome partitioning protein
MYESNTRLAQEVVRDLQEYLDKSRVGNAPWAKARIFATRIRRNIKLAECPSFGKSIFAYAPHCNGAADYAALAREILGEVPVVLSARVELDERGQASVLTVESQPAAGLPATQSVG